MITKLILDTEFAHAGMPVAFLSFECRDERGTEMVTVELPSGKIVEVPAAAVEAGHEPEESLSTLAKVCGVPYNTLARYAREGHIMARKSGRVWLSTRTAVEYAGIKVRE